MLQSYLKLAWKVLLRRKFFTFVSLFAISVTLLVLLVATAMLDSIFAPQAPETRGDRTLGIYQVAMVGPDSAYTGPPGFGLLDRYARGLPKVERASFFSNDQAVAAFVGGHKLAPYLKRTDGEFWRILDFDFLEGGPFTAADDAAGNPVAVINETTRRRFFGGLPAVGRSLEADGQRFRVVGVVRDVPLVRIVPFSDIWVPNSTAKTSAYRQDLVGGFLAIFLAEDRADFPVIQAELTRRFRHVELPDPKTYHELRGYAETLFDSVARSLFSKDLEASHADLLRGVIALAALLFLLLPTVNLVNLNLSRILDRSSEIGVRKAFGASSWTLVGQFIVENLVLTLLGGVIGLGLAAAVLAGVNASGLVPYAHFTLNLRVFGYGLLIAVVFGLLSGAYPAWRMSRLHPVQALRGRSA